MDSEFPSGLSYSKEEADDFLERVEDVNKQIKDILEGKIDVRDLEKKDKEIAERERLKKVAAEIKAREREELIRKGRPGKGH